MFTYIQQLDARCAEAGITLEALCEAEGLAASTVWRWRHGRAHCHERTARALFDRLDKINKAAA